MQHREGLVNSPVTLHFSETQTTVLGTTLCGLTREVGLGTGGTRVHLVHDHVLENVS